LSNRLHPRTAEGCQLSRKKQAIVPVTECPKT
jgi:hypothetical protein